MFRIVLDYALVSVNYFYGKYWQNTKSEIWDFLSFYDYSIEASISIC